MNFPGRLLKARAGFRWTAGLAAGAAFLVAACAAPDADEAPPSKSWQRVTIHSSSGPPISLWSMNEEIGRQLAACGVADRVEVLASALPESINEVGARPDRQTHYPMVTPVDFDPAVVGDGPVDWHDYPEPHPDLKFIASLYEVGFGVLAFNEDIRSPEDLKGKRIAVARRPSSLRVLAESLLRDGWGVLDDVTLVDMPPYSVAEAAVEGSVDATTWSLMIATDEGYQPLDPALLQTGHWISVSAEDVQRINQRGGFTTGIATIDRVSGSPPGGPEAAVDLVSFNQGLAGWSSSDDAQITAILECLSASGRPGHERRLAAMSAWPGLNRDMLHPAAWRFFRARNPEFAGDESR